jgi:hypothetical protein
MKKDNKFYRGKKLYSSDSTENLIEIGEYGNVKFYIEKKLHLERLKEIDRYKNVKALRNETKKIKYINFDERIKGSDVIHPSFLTYFKYNWGKVYTQKRGDSIKLYVPNSFKNKIYYYYPYSYDGLGDIYTPTNPTTIIKNAHFKIERNIDEMDFFKVINKSKYKLIHKKCKHIILTYYLPDIEYLDKFGFRYLKIRKTNAGNTYFYIIVNQYPLTFKQLLYLLKKMENKLKK